jgi:hypothetical protein
VDRIAKRRSSRVANNPGEVMNGQNDEAPALFIIIRAGTRSGLITSARSDEPATVAS